MLAAIAIAAGITLLTRAVPFLLFGKSRQLPKTVRYLGSVLPCAIMAILVVYCLKNAAGATGLAQLVSAFAVAVLQLKKKNTCLSIVAGTLLYMALLRLAVLI